jgi:desulfoferrodoxin (superoxide reductase-like protein)
MPYQSLQTFLCIVAAALVLNLFIPPVSAHPPSDMSVTYLELSKELRVTITHAVPNPGEHYIKEVTVSMNGKVVNDSRYTSQPAPDTFTYTYPIETGTTDEIKVTATCSLAGSLSRTLYNTGPVATQKAAAGLAPLVAAATAFLIRKK